MEQALEVPPVVLTDADRALIERIIKQVEEEPKRLEMDTWLVFYDAEACKFYDSIPLCLTVGCFAGWAVLLHDGPEKVNPKTRDYIGIERRAQEIFGWTKDFADTVFYTAEWPDQFRDQYLCATDKPEQAAALVARLRNLLAEGK